MCDNRINQLCKNTKCRLYMYNVEDLSLHQAAQRCIWDLIFLWDITKMKIHFWTPIWKCFTLRKRLYTLFNTNAFLWSNLREIGRIFQLRLVWRFPKIKTGVLFGMKIKKLLVSIEFGWPYAINVSKILTKVTNRISNRKIWCLLQTYPKFKKLRTPNTNSNFHYVGAMGYIYKKKLFNCLEIIGSEGKEATLLICKLQIKQFFGSKKFVKNLRVFIILAGRRIYNFNMLNFQAHRV